MKKLLGLFIILLMQLPCLYAQQVKVVGEVISADDGEPVIGASIIVKGETMGTVTDYDGKFTLETNLNATLIVSYVGMKTQEVRAQQNMRIVLEYNLQQIDDVIVIAYGTGKKSTFTGSATVVKSDAIERIKTSNITQTLQGQSPGIQVINSSGQPGDDASIMIRGIGSMNASSSPLYVVDGIAYDGYQNAINPSDVESMTILKDAAATALYGSRAANGVIVITTKKGTSEKGSINFRSTFGFSKLAVDLPRALTPNEFTELTWMAIKNGYMDNSGDSQEDAAVKATNYLVNELGINPYSIDRPVGLDGKIDPSAELLYWGDWRNELFSSRLRQEYNIDFSGKNQKGDYFVSGAYVSDKGIFTNQQFERFSIRANLNYDVKDWLRIGTNTNMTHNRREVWLDDKSVWFLRTISPLYPVYEWDANKGDYKVDSNGNKVYDFGDNRKAWTSWNPLADAAYNKSPETVNNLSSRSYIELTILPELKFRTNFSVDYYMYWYDGYVNSEYGYAAGYGGQVSKETRKNMSYTINNLLTYNKTFGEHSVSVLLGQEAYAMEYKNLSASKRGLPFLGLTEIASASEMNAMNSYKDEYRLLSWFSRVEYDFRDRYYISGSLRTDGSSRFHPDNRWGTFWSVGASWRISNEEFMQPYSWIDNLKLKGSYGAVGNDKLYSGSNPIYYAYQGLYSTGSNDYNNAGVRISRLSNRDLKWESNIQLNLGVDFSFLNKISGSVEWFRRASKDLLFSMPMAPSTGFSSIDRNIGDVRNQGFEFDVHYLAVNNKNFKWNISLNATSYKNKIVKLPQEEMNSGYFKWREGESRYNFWGVEYAGVDPETGNDLYWRNIYETNSSGEKVLVDRKETEDYNSLTSDDQKQYLGDAIPKLFGGLTNTFSYKGIDLSFMIYYSIGGKLYDGDYAQMMSYRTGYSMHPDMLDAWTPENTSAKFPRLSSAYANTMNSYSSRFLYDNSFMRLRNVTVGYTLPRSFTSKYLVNDLRLFIQGDNIWTVGSAAKRGTDPEQHVSGTTDNRFPTTKSVSFGLQLNF